MKETLNEMVINEQELDMVNGGVVPYFSLDTIIPEQLQFWNWFGKTPNSNNFSSTDASAQKARAEHARV